MASHDHSSYRYQTSPIIVGVKSNFYKSQAESPFPDPAALWNKTPHGIEYDDTVYTTTPNALLRPGIMLSSSVSQLGFKSTTSGILVVDGIPIYLAYKTSVL